MSEDKIVVEKFIRLIDKADGLVVDFGPEALDAVVQANFLSGVSHLALIVSMLCLAAFFVIGALRASNDEKAANERVLKTREKFQGEVEVYNASIKFQNAYDGYVVGVFIAMGFFAIFLAAFFISDSFIKVVDPLSYTVRALAIRAI